jgi:pimeloyl-ACP methyl ester carboxylesterase
MTAAIANNSNHALAQKASPALTEADLSSIALPALIVQGSDDPVFPIEHARWAAAKIPGSKLCVIDSMGHALDPAFFEPVAQTLRDFYGLSQEPEA